jgi:glycolate dehydrogenase FAD-binding subunit
MSLAAKATATRLAEVVGDAHVALNGPGLDAFAIGGVRPSSAARPGSAEETAKLVKFASTEKLGVVACGARTKLQIGLPPRKYDLALDMTRLDRVIAYDPDDLTLSVEAGIPLHKLNGALADRGQFLPLDPPFCHRATVGGTIASAMDSPLRQFYGTTRDFILGMEFVTGDGTLAKSGGRVVKNVTGYDLHKLMIGSLGTLGVITKINFRTFPLPHGIRAFIANFDTPAGALDFRSRVSGSPLKPLTMEIFSPGVAELFYSDAAARIEAKPLPPSLVTGTTWAFTSGFAGTETVLARCETEMRAMAGQARASAFSVLEAGQIPAAFGRKREFVAIALESSPAGTIVKASVLPSRMGDILAEIESAAAAESLRCASMARGVGVIYASLLPDELSEEARERVSRIASRILAACEKADGHATIPWCPWEWKSALKIWGADRAGLPLMRKLKAVFDPQGILSPGRFVGGI